MTGPNKNTKQKALTKQGKALRQFIDHYFASYNDFAGFVGVSPSAVTHWMNGRSPIPQRVIEALSQVNLDMTS